MLQKADTVTRVLLGLIFSIFGTNGLLMIFTGSGFIPMPEPAPEMGKIMGALFGMTYLMPLVKALEVVAGLFLLTGRFVNLALVLLAPIVVNILGIHLFSDPAGIPMALILTALVVFQIKRRWEDFRPLVSKT